MPKRVPFIVGNWKMHMTRGPAERLARDVTAAIANVRGFDVALCPPATALDVVGRALAGTTVVLCAQTIHY